MVRQALIALSRCDVTRSYSRLYPRLYSGEQACEETGEKITLMKEGHHQAIDQLPKCVPTKKKLGLGLSRSLSVSLSLSLGPGLGLSMCLSLSGGLGLRISLSLGPFSAAKFFYPYSKHVLKNCGAV